MKKHLLWIPVLLIAAAGAMHTQVSAVITPAKPVDKNISFAVYKGVNYSSEVYNNTSAQVHITVEKVSGDKRTIVWEQTLDAKQLNQYPTLEQAMKQTVTIPNVLDSKERIEVSYTLTYDSQGSTLQMMGGSDLTGNDTAGQLNIMI